MFKIKIFPFIFFLLFALLNNVAVAQKSKKPVNNPARKTGTPPNSPKLTELDLYNATIGSMVKVVTACQGFSEQGSGFMIDARYVVTNKHVVDCNGEISVKQLLSQDIYKVTGKYLDPDHDLAILEAADLDAGNATLKLAPNGAGEVGSQIFVIGNPSGVEGFFTKGNIRLIGKNGSLYFDAIIAPGSSGSPVLDGQGKVIGVETTGTKTSVGIVYGGAIPVTALRNLISRVKKNQIANSFKIDTARRNDQIATATQEKPVGPPSVTSPPATTNPRPNPFQKPQPVRELSFSEQVEQAEAQVRYNPEKAISLAQAIFSKLDKGSELRKVLATRLHNIIIESYLKLNQVENAGKQMFEAWQSDEPVAIKVKQARENKNFSNPDPNSWKAFVDGELILSKNALTYKQNSLIPSTGFPDQSFSVKDTDAKVGYNALTKKLEVIIKFTKDNGKEGKKDFQFYPPEVFYKVGGFSYGMVRQADCGSCSDILTALVTAMKLYNQEISLQKK